MSKKAVNLLFTGVGGQGVLLISEIAARVFLKSGYDVKTSALHGIAQRGGTILSHVRAGERIYSPLIPYGTVDIVVGMELSEAARQAWKIKKGGLILYTDRQVPSSRQNRTTCYSSMSLKNIIREKCPKAVGISYEESVKLLKDEKTLNLFILGMLSNYFSLRREYWIEIIEQSIPFHMKKKNVIAFEAGNKNFNDIKIRK
ncbi:MAG: 2-oxoacid:acceptor oxidoreductase family protein [Candidatus Omnitrophica bacterium]|nr:2-oxoacid:acceptor oxidoreductase family protein [Candidatus Omnitrophota bacterium]